MHNFAFICIFLYSILLLTSSKNIRGQILSGPILNTGDFPHASIEGKRFNSTTDYIESYGYIAEHHNIISEDGFIISVYRIPRDGPPILMQHGYLLSSDSWVLQGPQKDLAFILADKGYDIWLSDLRGNSYSKSHVRLSSKSPKFWSFSFHETIVYDLPAIVNYILKVTKKPKLDGIGHSLGASSLMLMCSMRPEFNDKIRSIIGLAPAVWFNYTQESAIMQLLLRYNALPLYLNRKFNVQEFFPRSDASRRTLNSICRKDRPLFSICVHYMQNVLGLSIVGQNFHKPILTYALASPRGTSFKSLQHLTQISQYGKLRQFDYGPRTNNKLYGRKTPPDYDFSSVTVPVVLIYSDTDIHVPWKDVVTLSKKLPNVVANYKIDKQLFNHLDFIWGIDAKNIVYDFITNVLSHFDKMFPNT